MKGRSLIAMLLILILAACSQPDVAPTAVIIAPEQIEAGHIMTVTATNSTAGTTPIVSYAWEMGDGATAFPPAINYSYGSAGMYDITLMVTDETGLNHTTSYRLEVTQIAAGTPPTAVIEGPTSAQVGETVTFTAENTKVGSDPISKFQWQAGDCSGTEESINAVFSTSYATPGTYTPIVTVVDNKGLSDSASLEIVIHKTTP